MKHLIFAAFALLLLFASEGSWAADPASSAGLPSGRSSASQEDTLVPLMSGADSIHVFDILATAAIQSRDLGAIMALYQTNGVSAEELQAERARWRGVFDQSAAISNVFMYFKDINKLPPERFREAYRMWTEQARYLTSHVATHLVILKPGTNGQMILPLVLVDDKILILPSNKMAAR